MGGDDGAEAVVRRDVNGTVRRRRPVLHCEGQSGVKRGFRVKVLGCEDAEREFQQERRTTTTKKKRSRS